MAEGKIAVVLVRGHIGSRHDIRQTLNLLRLYRKNYCVVVPDNECFRGMINKAKDYITYGPIDAETEKLLVEKRGEKTQDGIKPFFRLSPPKKGFGRKGIKVPFSEGGALGNRESKINDLIKRMI